MEHQAKLQTPFGILGIACDGEALTGIEFLVPGTKPLRPHSSLAEEACRQLTAYFADADFRFELPLGLAGTPYQRQVWQIMRDIPRGQVRSYGEVAGQLHSIALAVGQACGANPFPIVVPCHRIIGKAGIGGFANNRSGYLLDIKRWLLTHEGVL